MKQFIISLLFGFLMATSASSQIVLTAPDTVVWGDSICVDVTVPAQYQFVRIMWFLGQPPIVLTGGMTHHLCSIFEGWYECYGLSNWDFYFVDPNNVHIVTIPFSIFIDRSWHIANQAIGATSAVFDFSASRPVHMRFSTASNPNVILDSIDILPPGGAWTIMGLTPQADYLINAISANWTGQTFSYCGGDIQFTTDMCGVATLSQMSVINNGNDLVITLQYPNWIEGSFVWVNGSPILLSATGTNGPWSTMTIVIPYAATVTVISPCGDTYSYNTLTTGTDPSISTSVKITSQSISVEDTEALIEVYDMNGRMITSGIGKIDLIGLPASIYVYRALDSEGTLLSQGKFPKL